MGQVDLQEGGGRIVCWAKHRHIGLGSHGSIEFVTSSGKAMATSSQQAKGPMELAASFRPDIVAGSLKHTPIIIAINAGSGMTRVRKMVSSFSLSFGCGKSAIP